MIEHDASGNGHGERIEVVLATDGRGAFMAHVAIRSLLESLKSRLPVRITVLVSEISEEQCAILRGAAAGFDFATVQILSAAEVMEPYRDVLGQEWVLRGRWPMAVWARCFVDVLMPRCNRKPSLHRHRRLCGR